MLLSVATPSPNESHGVQGVAGSNPAVPTGVSSRSHPLVNVSGNSSDRLGRPVKGRPRYFTYMEHVRLVPGDLPAQWRQRDSWTELGVLLVRDGSHKIRGTLRI